MDAPSAIRSAAASAHTAEEAGNLYVVRQRFEAWTSGEGTVFDLLTPDMTWTIEGSSPSAGRYDRAALDALLKPFNAHLAAPLEPRLRALYADSDQVIALFGRPQSARGLLACKLPFSAPDTLG